MCQLYTLEICSVKVLFFNITLILFFSKIQTDVDVVVRPKVQGQNPGGVKKSLKRKAPISDEDDISRHKKIDCASSISSKVDKSGLNISHVSQLSPDNRKLEAAGEVSSENREKNIKATSSDTVTLSMEQFLKLLGQGTSGDVPKWSAKDVQNLLLATDVKQDITPLDSKDKSQEASDVQIEFKKPLGDNIPQTGSRGNKAKIASKPEPGDEPKDAAVLPNKDLKPEENAGKVHSVGDRAFINPFDNAKMKERDFNRKQAILRQLAQSDIQQIEEHLISQGRSIKELSSLQLEQLIGHLQQLSQSNTVVTPEQLHQIYFFLQSQGIPLNTITYEVIKQVHEHLQTQGRSIMHITESEVQELLMMIRSQQNQSLAIVQQHVNAAEMVSAKILSPIPNAPNPNLAAVGDGQGSDHSSELCQVVFKKSDGSSQAFMVNEQHGQQVYNLCSQADIANSSQGSGPAIHPEAAVQAVAVQPQLPPAVAPVQQQPRSENSDTTCSSIGSGHPSFPSPALLPIDYALAPSTSTR